MKTTEIKSTAGPAKASGPFFRKGAGQERFFSGQTAFFGGPRSSIAASPLSKRGPGVQMQQAPALPTFQANNFVNSFANFNAQYAVVGPSPATGTLSITHHVFLNFPRTMTKTEQSTFQTDFIKSVHDGWSKKHLLTLTEPGFSKYQCDVDVNASVEANAKDAQTVIHVVRPGDKDKRFRSRVSDATPASGSHTTHEAKLDFRDPTVLKDMKLNEADFLLDVGNFDLDKSDLNADCLAAIEKIKDFIAKIPPGKDPDDPCTFYLLYTGRASAEGSAGYNKSLGQRRIAEVSKVLDDLPGFCLSMPTSAGKEEATTDPSFRRVSVGVFRKDSIKAKAAQQNVAAHEFGHMIGLGDEYVDPTPDIPGARAKFFGDKPTHYNVVKDLEGQDAADETKIQDSANIMSKGNEVKRGHYVVFVAALDVMTRPEIEAATGKADAKWNVL